jgi:hypothetical protein
VLSSRNLTGAFTWQTDFNFSINRNETTKLSSDNDIFVPGDAPPSMSTEE